MRRCIRKCAGWSVKSCWRCATWARAEAYRYRRRGAYRPREPKGQTFRPDAGSDGEGGPRTFRKLAASGHYPRASGNHEADHRFTAISQWWATMASSSIAGIGSSVQATKGIKVRHLIEAKAADQSMHIARFQPRLKHALPLTALKNIFQNRQGGAV